MLLLVMYGKRRSAITSYDISIRRSIIQYLQASIILFIIPRLVTWVTPCKADLKAKDQEII